MAGSAVSAELAWSYFKGKHFGQAESNLLRIRNRLMLEHQGLVRQVAHRMKSSCAVPYQDLEQLGFLGLAKAVERFDPTKGIAFSSFATPYVRGEIMHFIRDRGTVGKIPRRWRELHAKIRNVEQVFAAQHQRQPSAAEIALKVCISEIKVLEVQAAIAHQHALEFKPEVCNLLTVAEPEPQTEAKFTTLQQRIDKLPAQDQQILKAVYFERQPRKQTATTFRLTPEALKLRIGEILQAIA